MLGLLLFNSVRLLDSSTQTQSQRFQGDVTRLMEAALSARLFERDYSSIKEILEKTKSGTDSDVIYVAVFDELGRLYAHVGTLDPHNLPHIDGSFSEAIATSIYDIRRDLSLAGKKVGQVQYGVSLANYISTRDSLIAQGALIAAIEISLSILLIFGLGYLLTRHVSKLVSATNEIANGNYTHKIGINSSDEIGELARNFALMTTTIGERIDALERSEKALFEEKEKAQVTLHSIGDAVITTDVNSIIEYVNPVAEALTGWSCVEAKGRRLEEVFQIVSERSRRALESPVKACLAQDVTKILAKPALLIRRNGGECAIEDSATPIRNRAGIVIGAVLVFHDVSHARKMARQLEYQASHDALTGLVNRPEFERRLRELIGNLAGSGKSHAVCYLDLDQFKIVNDTCGHIAGDELLRQVAKVLRSCFRETDTLARLGGDEFGVLLRNCPASTILDVTQAVVETIKSYQFEWNGRTFEIGVSVGAVPLDENSSDIASILSAADVACYVAKDRGRGRVYVYRKEDEEQSRRFNELSWISEIRAALSEQRLTLYCQKMQRVHPGQEEEPPHFELLLRMIGRNDELILPSNFIPVAERFGLVDRLDYWVVGQAIQLLEALKKQGRRIVLSVNLSGQSIASEEFHKSLITLLEASDIEPGLLCFEVTETAAVQNMKHATHFISDMKSKGCAFLLDDFGSGLSSFGYLKSFDVDFLKIDGSLVRDIAHDRSDAAIVESIQQVGQVLGIKTVAEYVENADVLDVLKRIGVDYAQGYAIHVPESISCLLHEGKVIGQKTRLAESEKAAVVI